MRVLRSTPILLLLLVLGCSDPAPGVDGGSFADAAAPDSSAADASTDDAAVDDASVDDAAVGDAATVDASPLDGSAGDASTSDAGTMRGGLVSLTNGNIGGTMSHVLFGLFARLPIDDLRAGIVVAGCAIAETSGSCILVTCPGGGTIPSDRAGELRASVGGVRVATATADASGIYSSVGTGAVFAADSVVTIEATGDVVPAFSADVVAPGPLTAALPSTVLRTAPLTITWSASGAGALQLGIVGSTGTAIRCIVPAADGTLTVDATLLDGFATGANVQLTASAFTTTEITAGDYAIDVSVAQGVAMNGTIE